MKGTEDRNPRSMDLDAMSCKDIVELMNSEDMNAVNAVRAVLPEVASAAEMASEALSSGGRLIYIGAGTSGRLGVLDASECPPTFGVDEDTVVGIIAGGDTALRHAVENAEDDAAQGAEDLRIIGLCSLDMVLGIAASGRTPYVAGALEYAKRLSCRTAALVNNSTCAFAQYADVVIDPETGPEVLTGSTRLKAGTAQKMILNMISTSAMVRMGKVYQNLMVDVRPSNEKLRRRAERIVMDATGEDRETAARALLKSDGNAKLAIVMLLLDTDSIHAKAALERANGHIRSAVNEGRCQP